MPTSLPSIRRHADRRHRNRHIAHSPDLYIEIPATADLADTGRRSPLLHISASAMCTPFRGAIVSVCTVSRRVDLRKWSTRRALL
ncbi:MULTISPECIES: hypothetical protein, partial [unclassified Mycobacteroides]|uniref:hypothetical protein n=1 Tax=unclassified Mycobacteroides TaxID=2618759 RepID=UPI001969BE6A